MSPQDVDYALKTEKLKEYLRKKIIHAQIFNTTKFMDTSMGSDTAANDTKSKMNNTSGRNEKNPLTSQEVTCDFNGAPIQIQKITNFKKALLALPRVDLPEKPVSVLKDPDEIAMALG